MSCKIIFEIKNNRDFNPSINVIYLEDISAFGKHIFSNALGSIRWQEAEEMGSL